MRLRLSCREIVKVVLFNLTLDYVLQNLQIFPHAFKTKKMAAALREILDLVLENLDSHEDIEIS